MPHLKLVAEWEPHIKDWSVILNIVLSEANKNRLYSLNIW